MLALDWRGAGNDQRGARFIDEDRVDFVDDTIPVIALDLIVLAGGHTVIAEVIETEFGSGTIGNIATIHFATHVGAHLLLDTADGEAQILVKMAHPLGVTTCKVVIDSNELGISAREGV